MTTEETTKTTVAKNYLVGSLWTNRESGEVLLSGEKFHETIEIALADYQKRFRSERELIICKVLQVKTVLVDYDAAGVIEQAIG